ncbi:hypothetical protein ACMT1E_02075 [Sphingomonas flavalba]|uniref:hypothetical protein n=1 Tax=Sphingomonas flavalba TaxID=2559804 RepID=UPI0039E1F709
MSLDRPPSVCVVGLSYISLLARLRQDLRVPVHPADGANIAIADELLRIADAIGLVDHDVFRSVPFDKRAGKIVYDTRGIWPDQPKRTEGTPALKLTG